MYLQINLQPFVEENHKNYVNHHDAAHDVHGFVNELFITLHAHIKAVNAHAHAQTEAHKTEDHSGRFGDNFHQPIFKALHGFGTQQFWRSQPKC